MLVDETWLSKWFVCNYIQKCLQLDNCTQHVLRLFHDISTSVELQNAVSALVVWKQNRSLLDSWIAYKKAEFQSLRTGPLTAQSCVCCMTQWTKIYSHLSIYFRAVALLHVASRSLKHGLNDELIDILATICGPVSYTHLTLPTNREV